jgi:ERF superfamily
MHRSSDTIGNISGALAKAQAELTNPEKSLTATIRSPFPRERDRTFRYAPLSSGLDIIRKSLGRHEIATIQSTGIDKEAGLLRLTTILAHSSGEWISSEWPVCSIRDIASAQRMGAALTYARRYALFALVGIAGEDDLDAPDLGANPNPTAELARPPDLRKQSNGQATTGRTVGNQGNVPTPSRSALGAQLSASLRESLIEQMAAINSADQAAAWAHRNLPAKNTLTAADAKLVEEAFAARLFQISDASDETRDDPTSDDGSAAPTPGNPGPAEPPHAAAEQRVMQSRESNVGTGQKPSKVAKRQSRTAVVRALGKTVRLRDKDHRKFVLRQACLVCGRVPSDPHHLTFTQPRALGRRVSDEFIVPVCRVHHRELHRSGDEAAWWRRFNIDPLTVALRLWQQTRGDSELSPSGDTATSAKAAESPEPIASRDPNGHPGTALSPASQFKAEAALSSATRR